MNIFVNDSRFSYKSIELFLGFMNNTLPSLERIILRAPYPQSVGCFFCVNGSNIVDFTRLP